MEVSYVIISPIRNEEKLIEKTIKSVISQSIKPKIWIIVNDGSIDNSENIIRTYLFEQPWIKLKNLPDRGYRKTGAGVIDSFYEGYKLLNNISFDFIVKLDGDISIRPDYFFNIIKKFHSNQKLGIAAGWVYDKINNKLRAHKYPDNHVRGCIKTYRRECWEDIGGLFNSLGWDGIDEMKAQMKGWETRSFKDITVIHHRLMGSVGGILKGHVRNAYAACKMGYNPLFIIGRGLKQSIFEKPPILGGFIMILGYFYFKLKRIQPIHDQELINFIRKEQKQRIKFWKKQ